MILSGYCFMACSGKKETKVLVMASGKVQIKEDVIILEPGTTHTENDVALSSNKLTVTTAAGSADFSVSEPGLYILNIKNDTLIGSYQHTGADASQQVISQESLKTRIDSLHQLMAGRNASSMNRNYFILPNQVMKISSNTNAQIIGPYKKVPGSLEGGKEYEIYKFYTNKEMHEIVDKLTAMVQ